MPDSSTRLHPAQVAFGPESTNRFAEFVAHPTIEAIDPLDRDAWLLTEPVARWLRQLRPESGLGEAVHELAVLAHQGYLFWKFGRVTYNIAPEELDRICTLPDGCDSTPEAISPCYLQLPPRRVWGTTREGTPPEPLDGWFAHTSRNGSLELAAVFGLHPGRDGFTVVTAAGKPPFLTTEADRERLFLPTLPGAEAAGLWSIRNSLELLELAWRSYSSLTTASQGTSERQR